MRKKDRMTFSARGIDLPQPASTTHPEFNHHDRFPCPNMLVALTQTPNQLRFREHPLATSMVQIMAPS
jgi:hypothetical protein